MSFYRNVVWFSRGLKDYTKGGYESASKNFNPADLDLNVDCSGKSYMITGGNSGIGKCIALDIAKRGGTVHLVCRNKKSAQETQTEIQKASGNNNIHIHPLDLSDSKGVVEFGRRFVDSGTELDVLVNNAGCMINTREIDSNGNEKNFATNTLGTHLLTTTLIPLLSKYDIIPEPRKIATKDFRHTAKQFFRANRPRVIIVSSGGMLVQKLNVDDWQLEKEKKFDGTMAYAQNKRQQVVITEHYAKQYPKIYFSAMHPGWADTPAVRSSMPEFYEKMKDRLRTAEQGADTASWLAISEAALQFPSGLFFQDRRPVPTHLPFAWTRSTKEEEKKFMEKLATLTEKFVKN